MNERIEKLAEQAGIAVWGDAVYMYNPKDTLDSAVLEKFAELIVEDCAGIVDNWGRWLLHDKLAVKIKQHFGVKND